MALIVTNSLTRKKETFVPLNPGQVKMYVCGPTVYGLTHVGNARPIVFFDTVRRYFEFCGFKVTYVCNYTDVDDKIINRAREEKCLSHEISEKYITEFQSDMTELGVLPPTIAPKVTEHIPQIIDFIQKLIANNRAYVASDHEVFFSVRKFPGYGRLSGKNIDELRTGVRVVSGENKRDPLDFSLWKSQKSPDEPAWESPWGKGRPGWHIECSVMSTFYLGETFDIHGGGIDLMHPHHENEIAQSEALTHRPFARYWLHNNLVNVDSEKMSKSVGNILWNRTFIEKYTAECLKYLLLSGHYRSPIDFSDRHIRDCQAALHRVYSTLEKCKKGLAIDSDSKTQHTLNQFPELPRLAKEVGDFSQTFESQWRQAMDDDFNTAKVVGIVFDYVRHVNALIDHKMFRHKNCRWPSETLAIVQRFIDDIAKLSKVLGLLAEDPSAYLSKLRSAALKERNITHEDILRVIDQRNAARKTRDFAKADELRAELAKNGVELRDSDRGTQWDVVFT